MIVACDACQAEVALTVTGPTLLKRALPRGWRPRRIDGRTFILCDVCGNLRQFVGGLSPYLQSRLGLAPNVEIELPEYTELPSDWVKRSATGRRGRSRSTAPDEAPMVDINKVIAAGATNADPEKDARASEVSAWMAQHAENIARDTGIELSESHREVLRVLQDSYVTDGPARRARDLSALLDTHFADRGGRKYLFELFPRGPVAQGCRIAGVPVPPDAQDASFGSVL